MRTQLSHVVILQAIAAMSDGFGPASEGFVIQAGVQN